MRDSRDIRVHPAHDSLQSAQKGPAQLGLPLTVKSSCFPFPFFLPAGRSSSTSGAASATRIVSTPFATDPHPLTGGGAVTACPVILFIDSSLALGLLNSACRSAAVILPPLVGRLGKAFWLGGTLVGAGTGKLTERMIGPVSAGGDLELVPAPPDDHAVE